MFTSRKYSPLPTSANGHPRKRTGGGLPTWKRYLLLGTGAAVLVFVGYSVVGRSPAAVDQALPLATPAPVQHPTAEDDLRYGSPPFRPEPENEPAQGADKVHILPIDLGNPDLDGDKTPTSFDKIAPGADADADDEDPEDDTAPAADADAQGDAPGAHPTSFETDPNAAGTTHCSKAHGDKPLVQYALTIDAGSTGSRIHVYKFHNCGPSPQLEYETFKQLQPGLSSYAKQAEKAAESLDPLLEEANRVVPESLRSCTPVEVKATAGLRLLDKNGDNDATAILDAVRARLRTNWPYSVYNDKAVEIMEGKDEGVYAWITSNYLLGKIGEGVESTDTVAVMDLGGASTQIVFEPKYDDTESADKHKEEQLADGDHKYELRFGGKNFTLYQHSHLDYGLMRARRSVHNLIAFYWSFQQSSVNWDSLSEDQKVSNPCLTRGSTRRIELDPPGRSAVTVTMHGGNGGYDACKRVVELVMAKDAICEVKPCSFNGIYQPALIDTFKQGDFFALSYFTDRIQPLLPKNTKGAGKLTLSELKTMAQDVCAGPSTWAERWGDDAVAMDELKDRPEYCLDLTFMHVLLGLGYEIHEDRNLLVDKKINGVELGWALGAGIALIEKAELSCVA